MRGTKSWVIVFSSFLFVRIAPAALGAGPPGDRDRVEAEVTELSQKLHDAIPSGDKTVWNEILADDA